MAVADLRMRPHGKTINRAHFEGITVSARIVATVSASRWGASTLVLAFALAGIFGNASAAMDGGLYLADETVCNRPTPAEMRWLDAPAWSDFVEFIRVCKVTRAKNAAPAVLLFSVWADELYAKAPAGSATAAMPRPMLFSPTGRKLGELPANFPADPPSELQIAFREWRGGMPQEIALCIRTPTASGDQALPSLKYSANLRQYRQLSVLPSTPIGDCHAR